MRGQNTTNNHIQMVDWNFGDSFKLYHTEVGSAY